MPTRYCLLLLAAAVLARADSMFLDLNAFGQSNEPMILGDYFNGGFGQGAGGAPVGPGPNYGITGIEDQLWVYSAPGAPLGQNDVLSSPLHGGRPLFVSGGFTDALSFYFIGGELDPFNPTQEPYFWVDVLDKQGNELAHKLIGYEETWTAFDMPFSGTAYQVDFGSPSNNMGDFRFAGIQLGADPPPIIDPPPVSSAPEPAGCALLGMLLIIPTIWHRPRRISRERSASAPAIVPNSTSIDEAS